LFFFASFLLQPRAESMYLDRGSKLCNDYCTPPAHPLKVSWRRQLKGYGSLAIQPAGAQSSKQKGRERKVGLEWSQKSIICCCAIITIVCVEGGGERIRVLVVVKCGAAHGSGRQQQPDGLPVNPFCPRTVFPLFNYPLFLPSRDPERPTAGQKQPSNLL
jgi:hypothetical protein